MKILVLSDSHSSMSFMRRCVDTVKPDAVIHLGDHYDDGQALAEEYAHIRFYQVPGNCDRYRCPPWQPEILIQKVCGVEFYMTHGHKHSVKSYLGALLQDARASKVQAVLYGHTHIADCHQEEDGLWVLNPGSCGYYGGSAGIVEVSGGKIISCRLIDDTQLVMPW
ncbi:MAG: YfcE family phosphodiesterase [Oscillospiraceae bacterium]|nr:YfcE family phosphodiesterase [Oscillospiraceae bacterium]